MLQAQYWYSMGPSTGTYGLWSKIEVEASEQIDRTELTYHTRQGMPKVLSPGGARQ